MTGFINVWKAEGVSSAFVVNKIKRLAKQSCGHMGTLDPLASGVLPVGIGNATRLFDYFLSKTKVYEAKFRFGVTTDSLDRESELIFGGSVPNQSQIEEILPRFTGDIWQIPPKYSAVSVQGKRSYELARVGREVELEPKRIHIESIRLLEQTAPDEFRFEIVCGGGTYIRSLARDIAEELGTKGFMSELVRTRSGVFEKQTSVRLEELTHENFEQYLIPTQTVLPYPSITITDEKLYHGIPVECNAQDGIYKLFDASGFYGIASVRGGTLKTEKKLC